MTETSPRVTTQLLSIFDGTVNELLMLYEIKLAPVPIEIILQRPKPGMWEQINFSEMSLGLGNIKSRYSPRMSLARMLARIIISSDWGTPRKLNSFGRDEDLIRAFARALVMPREWLIAMPPAARTPALISMRYEVPEEDVRLRLTELGL